MVSLSIHQHLVSFLDDWCRRLGASQRKPPYLYGVLNLAQLLWHPLARNKRLETLLRIASWQIKSRLQDEIIFPWIANQKLVVQRGMTGATGNIYVGLIEFTDMMFVLHFLREGDLFFDIGANVGTYTVLASGVCGAKTWAFEPDKDAIETLNRNIAINNLQDLVRIHEMAVGDSDQQVAFTTGLGTENRVAETVGIDRRSVQQMRIDSVIGNAWPIFAKLDIEKHEEQALRGGRSLLERLQAISLETITPWSLDALSEYGFRRMFYDPFTRSQSTEPIGLPFANALFVKDFEIVKNRIASAPKITIFGRSI
jgi:FkbM family methyltransferase